MAEFTKSKLWTGDLKLLNGLIQKGYDGFITTEELYQDFLLREKKR